jgi:two-component system phosphate regulon sensor histidine kinase PhoR
MKEGLILISPSGGVLMANNSAAQIFGDQIYSETEERNILHICRDIAFQQGVKDCLSGAAQEIQLERDGRVFDVFFNPVCGDGSEAELSGGVILFFDITEKQAAENQRKEFSANVSHELKTPLTTISALAEMIGNGMAEGADVKEFAGKITEQCRRLVSIIEGVIRLSSFDEGKVTAEFRSFDLYELAASVVGVLRPKAEERSVAVEIAGDRFNIFASRYMMDEMLYNLIENAIKYNKENGGVTVRLGKEDGFCKISVSDTGIGIPPEDQPHVFERFYRADKSRSKKTGGAGLGLSIVKHIAARHGGRVELNSVPDEGTAITCFIPIQAPGSRF